ncbi:MAG: IPT/TIG domain-containing protein [Planctomycetota bacterium]
MLLSSLCALTCNLSLLLPQSINTVTPSTAAPGTLVNIAGSGFGDAKPTVNLVPIAGGNSIVMKVASFSDTNITASFTKGLAGSYTLRVQPKGKGVAPMDAPAEFNISVPTDGSFGASQANVDTIVTLSANHLGTKKGTVTVGGMKAKVLTWNAVKSPSTSDGTTEGSITFQMNKKTPSGAQPVMVRTAAGEATFNGLTVLSDGGGATEPNPFSPTQPGLSFLVDGAASPIFSPPPWKPNYQTTTNMHMKTQGNNISFFNIYADFDYKKETLNVPKVHIVWQLLDAVYSTTDNPFFGTPLSGASATLKITGMQQMPNGMTFGGTFTATLVKVMGIGPDTITITNGSFWNFYSTNF